MDDDQTRQALHDSDQFWAVHELTQERIEAIKDPTAQGLARAAMERHWANIERSASTDS